MFRRVLWLFLVGFLLFSMTGCEYMKEVFQEAMDPESGKSDDPNSDNYRMRSVVGVFAIVRYPRASELEREIDTLDGGTIWINTNQLCSSKNIRDARAVSRPGNPDVFDLMFRLDRSGKLQWEIMAGNFLDEPVALVIDDHYRGSFIPSPPKDDDDWVLVRVGIDATSARNVERTAKANYEHMNPDTQNWFR